MNTQHTFAVAFAAFAGLAATAFAVPQNIAPLGAASQSSTAYDGPGYNGSGPAGQAIDGDTDGHYWHGSVTHTGFEQGWWQVQLDQAYVLDEVKVWNRTDCCSARLNPFTVNVFLGNALVGTVQHNVMPGSNMLSFGQFAGLVGDRVQVAMERRDWLHLAEVQVFGEPATDKGDRGVPEPATAGLTALAAAGLLLRRRSA